MNTSEPESRWDEEQINQLLTRFFQREMPAEFRDAPPFPDLAAPVTRRGVTNSSAPRLTLPAPRSAAQNSSGSAGAILGLVVACLGLMVLAMVQTGAPDAPGAPVVETQASTPAEPAAPGTSTVQNPDIRTQPESAVNWQNPANSAPDTEPSADPLLQELDIQIFPLEEPARPRSREKRSPGER